MGLPEIVGRLLAARGVGIEAACDFLDPTLRALLPDPSVLIDMDIAADRLALRGAAGRDGRRVRRLRRGWRVQRRADGHAAARAWLRGAAPRAGPHDGGLWAERSGAAFAGAARRPPDRLRRLRHRRGRGAGLHRRRRRHRGAGPPQGGGPAAGDRRHGQSEPAGLHIRPDLAVRRRRSRS